MGNIIQGLSGIFGGGQQKSFAEQRDPFGRLPYQTAGNLSGQINPLLRYLGFGPQAGTRQAAHQERRLEQVRRRRRSIPTSADEWVAVQRQLHSLESNRLGPEFDHFHNC